MSLNIDAKWQRVLLVLFSILVVGIFVTTAFSRLYLQQYTQMLQEANSERLIQAARTAAETLLTPGELDELRAPEDMEKPVFAEKRAELKEFAAYNDLLFVYYMRLDDGQLEYIIDNDEDPATMVTPGMATEPDDYVMEAFAGSPVSTDMGTYAGDWDGFMSAYAPVLDEAGGVCAVAGVDIIDSAMVGMLAKNTFINRMFIFELIAMVIVSFFLILCFRQRAEEFRSASLAKSTFLSSMSHEIRTPMNAIIGLSRMSRQSQDIDEIHGHAENILSSSGYLLSLINNILDISKIEAGHMTLEQLEVNLPAMLTNIRTMIAPQTEAKRLTLHFETDGTVPETVVTDSTHLTQIIMNLLGNAVKFTPEGGSVTLSARLAARSEDAATLEFSVSDTGIGIAREHFARLFEPFEQESAGTTRQYGGTGLGLSIAKLLCELMGGHIGVESELGKGTTFTFDIRAGLPKGAGRSGGIAAGEIAQTPLPQKELPRISCRGKRFLIVEDNEINQVIAESMLSEFGAAVEFASNGLEGVDTYLSDPERFDAIFMDIQMPVMDGFEATRHIRKSAVQGAKTVPIIAMSANVFKEDVDKTFAAGMNAFIGKPLEPDQVAKALFETIPPG
ncbi:MAG: response regulator [Clostridiales Family XIII bacterium]|jgi:signal transduction histidine kinase|nr:response regulator [Clostridiales Family XIII bacterium]